MPYYKKPSRARYTSALEGFDSNCIQLVHLHTLADNISGLQIFVGWHSKKDGLQFPEIYLAIFVQILFLCKGIIYLE